MVLAVMLDATGQESPSQLAWLTTHVGSLDQTTGVVKQIGHTGGR
jgi:hypothetical protein